MEQVMFCQVHPSGNMDEKWNPKSYHVNRRRKLADDQEDLSDDEALSMEVEEAMRLQTESLKRIDPEDFRWDEEVDAEEDEVAKAAPKATATSTPTHESRILELVDERPDLLNLIDDIGFSQARLDKIGARLEKRGKTSRRGKDVNGQLARYVILSTYITTVLFYFKLLVEQAGEKLQAAAYDRLSQLRISLAHLDRVDEVYRLSKAFGAKRRSGMGSFIERFEPFFYDPEALERLRLFEPVWYAVCVRYMREHGVGIVPEHHVFIEGEDHEPSVDDDVDAPSTEGNSTTATGDSASDVSGDSPSHVSGDSASDVSLGEESDDAFAGSDAESTDAESTAASDTSDTSVETPVNNAYASSGPLANIPELGPQKDAEGRKANMPKDDFTDAAQLESSDAADKRSRRHSLRFHATQIEQKAGRRQRALGGDDDVPVRRSKQERRNMETERQMRASRGAENTQLDDEDPATEITDEQALAYYEQAARATKGAKDAKDAAYREQRTREKHALAAEEDPIQHVKGPTTEGDSRDAMRGVSYEIMANKGLTPRRSKLNRNPRVKKRKRFEQAQKKVSSSRPVYKDDAAARAGRYSGEQSGVGRVVKSRRL